MKYLNELRINSLIIFINFSLFLFYNCSNQPELKGSLPVIFARDYPTLQAAFDAVPDSGGMVLLPPGTFEIDQPLIISKSDFHLEGAGTATHIKNVNQNGQPAILIQHPSGEENRQAELWRISLTKLRITGNENSGNGIEARRINEIFINGVSVSYHGSDGILLHYCYEDPRITNSLITYNKQTGLNLQGCHDIVVSANQFEENMDALRCFDSFNLCMTGNNLDDHLGNGVVVENTYGSVIAGNMIEESSGAAIIMDRDCYGNTVSANVIAHNQSGGVDLKDAHGCAVSANTFTILGKDALKIGKNSGRITVTGNNFSDSYIGEGKLKRGENDRNAGGMVLEGASEIGVVGNLYSGVQPKALTVQGEPGRHVNFTGNVIINSGSDHKVLTMSVTNSNLVK